MNISWICYLIFNLVWTAIASEIQTDNFILTKRSAAK